MKGEPLATRSLLRNGNVILFPFSLFTRTKQIFRTIDINEYTKEIVTGYRFPNFFEIILSFFGLLRLGEICFRPLYYSDFDSFVKPLNLLEFNNIKWSDV